MSFSNAIIQFECTKPLHREALSRRGVGGLTIHDSAWAYCDAMTSDQEHEWTATGGVPQAMLVRWSKPASGSIAAQLDFGDTAARAAGRASSGQRVTSPSARPVAKRPTERAPR